MPKLTTNSARRKSALVKPREQSRNVASKPLYQRSLMSILVFFVVVLVLFGGASRYDEIAQLPVRLASLLVIAAAVFRLPGNAPAELRWPALLLASAVALVVLQLVPLPPGIWTSLPGREPFIEAAPTAGLAQPWRPLALSPDLAINALLSLTVPVAVLAGLAALAQSLTRWIIPAVLAILLISVLAVCIQLVTGSDGLSWIYRVLFKGWSPGIFTNRNHQAVLIAAAIPLLAGWDMLRRRGRKGAAARLAAGLILPLVAVLLIAIGSRAGLVLGAAGACVAILVFMTARDHHSQPINRRHLTILAAASAAIIALLMIAISLGRAAAIERMLRSDPAEDLRLQALPTILRVLLEYFPAGTGFGSFDPAFRQAEPDALLGPSYLNHAHNDLLQIVLEGGLPGLIILTGSLAWLAAACLRLWRHRTSSSVVVHGRAASVSLLVIVVASALDYPLRTPMMMAIAAGLTFQIALALAESQQQSDPPRSEDKPKLSTLPSAKPPL